MKILIIGFAKIKYMPYLDFHLKNLDLEKNDVSLVYWNRDCDDDASVDARVKTYEFKSFLDDESPKASKITSFIKFRKFTKKIIEKEQFDFITVFHSVPSLLFADILLKKYKNRYIFDYRDATYESFAPFKKAIEKMTEASYATFVSSDAFRKLLPESEKIYTTHNMLLASLEHRVDYGEKNEPLEISFWGFLRHNEINRAIVDRIANDSRFTLVFHGKEQETTKYIKNYCKENGIKNVSFTGEYKAEDRYDFPKTAALLHNIFLNDTTVYAVGNKFYDGIMFYIPMICNKGSFMGELCEKYGVGIAADPFETDFADKIFEYYKNLDREQFKKNCDTARLHILKEYNETAEILKNLQ